MEYSFSNFKNSFNEYINVIDIWRYNFMIRLENIPQKQIYFHFKNRTTYNPFLTMTITNIEDYIKGRESVQYISTFGDPYHILFITFNKYIDYLVKNNETKNIVVSFSQHDELANDLNSFTFEVDRSFKSLENSCPICKVEWLELYKVPLKCGHHVCSDCLFGLLNTNTGSITKNCPMCRKPILDFMNE